MGNISNISLKSLAIMFLFAAIFTYSHYLLIAAGFLGLVSGMLDKNESATLYGIVGVAASFGVTFLIQMQLTEADLIYLYMLSSLFIFIFLITTDFRDSRKEFYIALVFALIYRSSDYYEVFSTFSVFGFNAGYLLQYSQFQDIGLNSINRLAASIAAILLFATALKTPVLFRLFLIVFSFLISQIIFSRVLLALCFFAIFLNIVFYIKSLKIRNLIIVVAGLLMLSTFPYLDLTTDSRYISVLNLMSCFQSYEEFFFGNYACARIIQKSDFDSIQIYLLAFNGLIGLVVWALGIMMFCLSGKDVRFYKFSLCLAPFFAIHLIDVSVTKPEYFIPFLFTRLMENTTEELNQNA